MQMQVDFEAQVDSKKNGAQHTHCRMHAYSIYSCMEELDIIILFIEYKICAYACLSVYSFGRT